MKAYKVITLPSSDDEDIFENIENYQDAIETAKKNKVFFREMEFDTRDEAQIYIKGYLHGIGYLGDGLFYTDYL